MVPYRRMTSAAEVLRVQNWVVCFVHGDGCSIGVGMLDAAGGLNSNQSTKLGILEG